MENDGLPQQVCAICCAKLDFACEFFEECQSVQQEFSSLTSQNTEEAMSQKNEVRIEDENKNEDEHKNKAKMQVEDNDKAKMEDKNKDKAKMEAEGKNKNIENSDKNEDMNKAKMEAEDKDKAKIEADKENTAPVVKHTKNSKRIRRIRSRRQSVKRQENNTTLKEQIQNIVATNALNQKELSDPSKITAVWPVYTSQKIIVKQENVYSEEASSQSHKSIESLSRSDYTVRISIGNLQSNNPSACQETEVETSCTNTKSGDQTESKVNGESDDLTQTTDINPNGFGSLEIDNDAKTVTLPERLQSDSLILEESHEEARQHNTSVQEETSCVSKTSNSEKRNNISQLLTDEQKKLIETSYRINLSIMKCDEVQNKMIVLSRENFKCNICGVNYSRPDKCKVHIMTHLDIKPYECTKCHYTTVTASNIRAHVRRSHLKLKPYVCDQCDKRYGSMILLQEHMNSHTGNRPFKCNICDLAYRSRQGLNCHYKTHKLNKDIKCDICPKMFKSTDRKRAHMYVHNKENMIQCKICKSYLSNQASLDAHIKKTHLQKHVCDICNKEMLSRKDLYNHKNVHMEAKYKCTLCVKYYKSNHILKEHMLKHEGIRKYKCTDCGKTFAQKSHLAAHSATHSDIRFSCVGCEKQFNRRDNMKMHTKRCQLFLQKSDTFISNNHDKLINT